MELTVDPLSEEDTLLDLTRRANDGNASAFDALARRVRGQIRGWAERLTSDGDEAEDVTQLVLLRLHAHLGDFEGRSQLTSWLYRVTRNLAFDRRRIEERRGALLLRHQTGIEQVVERTETSMGEEGEALARLVQAYLVELPERQRAVFELGDLHGLTSAAIAERLGIKPSTVRATLLHARRAIRSRMLAEHSGLLEDYDS